MIAHQDPNDAYRRGVELADADQFEQALTCIQEYLLHEPRDAAALNEAGVMLHALQRYDEAARHLTKALQYLPDDAADVLANLAEVHLSAGRPDKVMDILEPLGASGALTGDLVRRVAMSFLDMGDAASAADIVDRAMAVEPQPPAGLVSAAEDIRAARPKLAFVCSPDRAEHLHDICRSLDSRFDMYLSDGNNSQEIFQLLQSCDVVWFEWCSDQLVAASRAPKTCRIIARLHDVEAYGRWPMQVRWENVDVLITPGGSAVRQLLADRVPQLREHTTVASIPIGIDIDAIAFRCRKGKALVCPDGLTWLANPLGLLQCFAELVAWDPMVHLHLQGEFQDICLAHTVRSFIDQAGLGDHVTVDPPADDLNAYMADKDIVVSARQTMGQPVGVHQAMAAGLKPVVFAFPGCGEFLDDRHVYRTPQEFCRRIMEEPSESAAYRRAVSAEFALADHLEGVYDVLCVIEEMAPLPAGDDAPVASSSDTVEPAGHPSKQTRPNGPQEERSLND
ncbi:MAG: tetratricopeptide repeat protein [Planctomycetota bacterium]